MTYVTYEEKSAEQEAAARKADEQWMKDHAPVHESTLNGSYYRIGVDAAFAVASAH